MNDREAYEYYLDPQHRQSAGSALRHPKDKLTEVLSVRISPALLRQVAGAAAAEGCSAAHWVRATLRSALMTGRYQRRAIPGRPEGLIPGSGRRGEPRALSSSLSLLPSRTFSCPHLSVGNVTSASCGTCGPLRAVG